MRSLDFTLKSYSQFLELLLGKSYCFLSFNEYLSTSAGEVIVLRHDVDALPGNSLEFAKIQAGLGIKGSYYFRIVTESYDERIIKEIYSLGHEVGYHYEDVALTARRLRSQGPLLKASRIKEGELAEIAIENFEKNLEKLRKIVPVKTICMHGNPMNKWDSRLLWKYYDYKNFGIVGEPYFDINFDEVLYLTDTGRRWDGGSFNVRDKAMGVRSQVADEASWLPHVTTRSPFPNFHTTFEIMKAFEEGSLPNKIMLTFHPQRWTDRPIEWMRELVWQNTKNVGKYFLVKMRYR